MSDSWHLLWGTNTRVVVVVVAVVVVVVAVVVVVHTTTGLATTSAHTLHTTEAWHKNKQDEQQGKRCQAAGGVSGA